MNNRHGAKRKEVRKHRRWLVETAGCVFCRPQTHIGDLKEWLIEASNLGARIPRSFRRYLP